MLQHYLVVFFRNIKRNPGFFFINLIGLSVGLACTFLIYLWLNDEMNVDKIFEKDEQLFQVMVQRHNSDNIFTQEHSPGPLGKALAEEMPEVEHYVTYSHSFLTSEYTLVVDNIPIKAVGDFVTDDFFNVFTYELLQGDKAKVLKDKSAIVISESLARKLFHSIDDVIGKTIEWSHEKDYTVSGVFRDVPSNASYQFDYLLPWENFVDKDQGLLRWDANAPGTCIVLAKGTDIQQFNKKIKNVIKTKQSDSNVTLFLKPYSDKYLYGEYDIDTGTQVGGRITYVRLFTLIAFFILLIACINFMNLSTAKTSTRIKEIGIKKAIGVDRSTLIAQYLGESLLMSFLALFVALIIVLLVLPEFNEITSKKIVLGWDPKVVLSLLGITLFTGLASGSYPALYLSGLNPAMVLKGRLKGSFSELLIRKILVIFQFGLSVILILGVLVVYMQIQYIQSKNLGYDKDNVIYFSREGWAEKNLDAFLAKVKEIPGVADASSMAEGFVGGGQSTYDIDWDGKGPKDVVDFQYRTINHGLLEVLGVEMVKGRTFQKDLKSDESKVIFNEEAVGIMRLNDPLNQEVKIWGENAQILGVTKNFLSESLRKEAKPLVFLLNGDASTHIYVRFESGRSKEIVNRLQDFYKSFNPGFPLDFRFLDDDYQALYSSEMRIGALSRYFAGFAIFISCLGLLGLAAFSAERRLKEIGIRKALSASKISIVYLLSSDFTKIILIAIAIALPIGYYMTSEWLNNFAYRIDLKLWYFLLAGAIALLVAWITIGTQAIKAANKNLIDCLRTDD